MTVIGASGHQDIPKAGLEFVRKGIERAIDRFRGDVTGISSLAEGADQIFAEAILRRAAILKVIVPCEGYETTFSHAGLRSYQHLLSRASSIEALKHKSPSEDAYLDAGHRVVDASEVLIAVWDGKRARGQGGTADIVEYAKQQGREVVVVWPPGMRR